MARKKKERGDSSELLKKITALESVFGQKETAKKLGVSPSTLRNYKTGKSKPSPEKSKKINRTYGQNKKRVTDEKIEKYVKKVQKKQEVRKKQLLKNPKLMSTQKWVRQEFDEEYIQVNILANAPPFVAPYGDKAQFTNGLSPIGIPKGTKSVLLYGLYITEFFSGGQWIEADNDKPLTEKSDLIITRFPILLRKEMNIEEALDYLERKFFETMKESGKRRYNPHKLIGYQL